MDDPFDETKLRNDHRYQIGDGKVLLSISKEGGKPRLSFVIHAAPNGVPFNPPARLHLATFASDRAALATVEFLDELLSCVNRAVAHYEQLCTPDLTQLTAQEPKHGSQN
jgi:hypothetical protein